MFSTVGALGAALFARAGGGKAASPRLNDDQGQPEAELALADPLGLYRWFGPMPYNPSELIGVRGYKVIDRIRKDEQVKAAMLLKKLAVLAPGWRVESPPNRPDDWPPTEFLRKEFAALHGRAGRTFLGIMSAFDFGFSISERVLTKSGRDGYIHMQAVKTKKPDSFTFRLDAYGNVIALQQFAPVGQPAPAGLTVSPIDGRIDLPMDKFVVYSYGNEFAGNPWGVSDYEATYRAHWAKDQSFRWMAMYLERFGIPPIFALYDPNRYNTAQVAKLDTVLSRIAAGTSGTIPRAAADSLELWTPETAGGGMRADRTFIPAMEFYDKLIARSILMPGMMGLTPDEGVGSLARSRVHFDVFMLVVDFLRKEIEDMVVHEQIVAPLMALNFDIDPDEYPRFKFLPVQDKVREDIMRLWLQAVNTGAVVHTEEDERHMRQMLEFPERDESQDGEVLVDPRLDKRIKEAAVEQAENPPEPAPVVPPEPAAPPVPVEVAAAKENARTYFRPDQERGEDGKWVDDVSGPAPASDADKRQTRAGWADATYVAEGRVSPDAKHTVAKIREAAPEMAKHLSDADLYAVHAYSTTTYNGMNGVLRGTATTGKPAMDADFEHAAHVTAAAMAKLPATAGEFYRGARIDGALPYKVGDVVSDPGIVSVSMDKAIVAGGAKQFGTSLYIIKGKSARDVSKLVTRYQEKEAVFLPGTKFKVADVKTGPDGFGGKAHTISLEEVAA